MDGDEISCRSDNPFRRPHWRWNRANHLNDGGRPAGPEIDDSWVKRATTYLAVASGSQQPRRGPRRPNDPVVAAAAASWERNAETRWRLEALVLAGQPAAAIAELCELPIDVVDAYEALFFDVRARLAARSWVICNLLGGMLPSNIRQQAPASLWRIAGFFGGVFILEDVIAFTLNGPVPHVPDPLPAGIADERQYEDYWRRSRESWVAMLTAETHSEWAEIGRNMKAFARQYPGVAGGIDRLARFEGHCDTLALLDAKPTSVSSGKATSRSRPSKPRKRDKTAARPKPRAGGSPSADAKPRPPKG